MRIAIIAALGSNRVIGRDNAMPWRLPEDLRRFKRLTMGHDLVMGRRTYESIGRPLPGRRTIVVSRQPGYRREGVVAVASIEAAIEAAQGDEVFIAGGADIYAQTLSRADRLYLTLIDQAFEGDAWFPAFDPAGWRVVEQEEHEPDADHGFPYRFLVYDR
jgi:dihydrofolate reductase